MTISEQDVELIKKFIAIRNRGHYADGRQLTEAYNRILGKKVQPTSCGQCLRNRVNELEKALRSYEKEQEALKNANESGFTTVEEAMAESKKIMEEHKEMEENKNAAIETTPKKKSRGKGSRSKGAEQSSV